jgi:hypothetical protein
MHTSLLQLVHLINQLIVTDTIMNENEQIALSLQSGCAQGIEPRLQLSAVLPWTTPYDNDICTTDNEQSHRHVTSFVEQNHNTKSSPPNIIR